MLERELGIEPSAQTRASLDRLLARLNPAAPRPPSPSSPAARSGLAEVPFVGRSAELGTPRALWASASAGRPTLAVVRGGAGVGKTRLLAELAELARARGAATARTQCFGAADRLALSPVADWLRTASIQAGLRTLDPVWRAEVDRLVPSGKRPEQPLTLVSPMADSWQRHRFFEGLARALLSGGRPLLLVLDNLQWCDQETLAFLSFYLGLTTTAPVMVAATLRVDGPELSAELADWTARMRATETLADVTLGPLDVPETARLAEAVSGRAVNEHDAPALHAATGGFPLHVVEATRGAVDGKAGPLRLGDLSDVLRARLDQLSPPALEVAGLAAGVGQDFTLDVLIEASDLDADSMVRAVDELWRRRIVHEVDDVHVTYGAQLPTGHPTMHLYPIDGAAARVPSDATAFAYRDGGWAGVIVGVDPDPANADTISRWTRDYWTELHPHSAGGAYVNFMMDEGQDRVRASYRENYQRLARVKTQYDPDNTFRVNQNIPPSGAPA